MSDQSPLLALAERCETATGPNRNLDAEIAPLTGLRIIDEGHPLGRCCYDANNRDVPLPSFTRSIDAALTLVPNDLAFGMKRAPCQRSHAMLSTIGEEWNGAGATAALAICAAALRALAPIEARRVET